MDDSITEKEIHISDYIDVFLKRKAVVAAFFMITVSVTMLFTFLAEPVFQSSAKMIIDKEKSSSPITGERVDYESFYSQTLTFNTHFKLIKSDPVLKEIIHSLNFDENKDDESLEINPFKQMVKQIKANIKLLLKIEQKEITPHEKMFSILKSVRGKISIEQVSETRLLTVAVKDKNPIMAAKIANCLTETYIKYNLSNRMRSSRKKLEWMNNELYQLKKNLEDKEKKFLNYKQREKVFSIIGKQKMMEQKISEFNDKYLTVKNRRQRLNAVITELEKHIKSSKKISTLRFLTDNPTIDRINNIIIDLEMEQTRLAKIFKSKHPKVLQIKSKLKKSNKRLSHEITRELANLKSERKVLLTREQQLLATIDEFENDALQTSSKELKYRMLKRDVETNKTLYDTMMKRVKESNILKTSDTSNLRIVEEAYVPVNPISPNKKRNLLLSIILGFCGGAGLAFFFEYLDQTIRTEEDIEKYLNIAVLSVIPEADATETYGAKESDI